MDTLSSRIVGSGGRPNVAGELGHRRACQNVAALPGACQRQQQSSGCLGLPARVQQAESWVPCVLTPLACDPLGTDVGSCRQTVEPGRHM
jgi:hypothetical protein